MEEAPFSQRLDSKCISVGVEVDYREHFCFWVADIKVRWNGKLKGERDVFFFGRGYRVEEVERTFGVS